MLTISYIYILRLLVLRLLTEFNFLYKLSIDTIYIVALSNFYLNALKIINLSIL